MNLHSLKLTFLNKNLKRIDNGIEFDSVVPGEVRINRVTRDTRPIIENLSGRISAILFNTRTYAITTKKGL